MRVHKNKVEHLDKKAKNNRRQFTFSEQLKCGIIYLKKLYLPNQSIYSNRCLTMRNGTNINSICLVKSAPNSRVYRTTYSIGLISFFA